MINKDYIKELKERGKKSHIYRRFQLIGLEIAHLLNDEKHKALYMGLAKKYDEGTLMGIARDVSDRKNIKNKGGYFMKVLQSKAILKKRIVLKKFKSKNKSKK
ncbi:MAG: hypothetical protein QMD86_01940 [Patescibacteria group bacterium]|nr:hypothetical protein [Patescibacteria group bacterium]